VIELQTAICSAAAVDQHFSSKLDIDNRPATLMEKAQSDRRYPVVRIGESRQ
jgi:hypothetical protein